MWNSTGKIKSPDPVLGCERPLLLGLFHLASQSGIFFCGEKTVSRTVGGKRALTCGVGVCDANYQVIKTAIVDGKRKKVWRCPFYMTWTSLLGRCYLKKTQERNPHYKGCTVVEEWLTFSVFKAWMETQDWEGKQLDKDIILPGNRIYGPEYCCFVSRHINSVLTANQARRGEFPIGVTKAREFRTRPYRAYVRLLTSRCDLGFFKTVEEAAAAYAKAKSEYLRGLAKEEADPRVRTGLHLHAARILAGVA